MTREFLHYRRLERRLWWTRWLQAGAESAEEDVILDEMESVWLVLSESEQALLRAEGPRCWPVDASSLPPQFADAAYVAEPETWSYKGFTSPIDAIAKEEAA